VSYEYLPSSRAIRKPTGEVVATVGENESVHDAWRRTFGPQGPGPYGEVEVPEVWKLDEDTRERTFPMVGFFDWPPRWCGERGTTSTEAPMPESENVIPFPAPAPEPDDETSDDGEPCSPEVLAELVGWRTAIRAAFPAYRWSVDGPNGKVVGVLHLDSGARLIHVVVDQDIDPDGDPEWLRANATLYEDERALVPKRLEDEVEGMDPRDPVRAVRVALRKLGELAVTEGIAIPESAIP
jgi:hypothetical protein